MSSQSFDDDDSTNETDNWYARICEEDDWPEDEDFRYMKVHPVIVNILEFFFLFPLRAITVAVLVVLSFLC